MYAKNDTTAWDTAEVIIEDLTRYYVPTLICLGLIGNSLSVCVFFGTKLRNSSISIYLGMLAISDTGFLVTIFGNWLKLIHMINLFKWAHFYPFISFLQVLSNFLSVWLVVAFTVERYVAMKWPLRRRSLCTATRAKTVVIGLTVLAVSYTIPWFIFDLSNVHTDVSPYMNNTEYEVIDATGENNEYSYMAEILLTIDPILLFLLPVIMIVIFNALIARIIHQQDQVRRALFLESDASNERTYIAGDGASQTKVTKMLVLVSSMFIFLNTPMYVSWHMYNYYDQIPTWLAVAKKIGDLLYYTNYGINFVLYCANGQNFRRALIRIFTKRSERVDSGRIQTIMQKANYK